MTFQATNPKEGTASVPLQRN